MSKFSYLILEGEEEWCTALKSYDEAMEYVKSYLEEGGETSDAARGVKFSRGEWEPKFGDRFVMKRTNRVMHVVATPSIVTNTIKPK